MSTLWMPSNSSELTGLIGYGSSPLLVDFVM